MFNGLGIEIYTALCFYFFLCVLMLTLQHNALWFAEMVKKRNAAFKDKSDGIFKSHLNVLTHFTKF